MDRRVHTSLQRYQSWGLHIRKLLFSWILLVIVAVICKGTAYRAIVSERGGLLGRDEFRYYGGDDHDPNQHPLQSQSQRHLTLGLTGSITPEEDSFLQTMRLYETFKERDMQYLGENPEDILARREWDGADERRQNEWKRRAKQRLQRFPHLSTDPKKEGDLIRIRDSRRKAEDMPSPAAAANDPLRNIFVVSLERRPSKRDHAIRQILECGLAAGESYIVNAVDGDGIVTQKSLHDKDAGVFPGYVGHNMHPIGLTTGEAGCFMSHYSIWLYMHEHNIPYAVILEDDFEIVNPPAFKQAVREVVDEACNSGTWDLLYLSRYPVSFDIQRLSKSLCIPGFSYWTVAYILTLNGARKLLNADGLKNMIGLDDWFSVLDRENVDDACVKPFTERYRSFFPHVLRRLAVVPPLIMPMKGAFFSSDTAKLRKDTRFIADLPIGGSPCLQEWRPRSRARAPGFSSRTPIKEEKLQTCPT